MLLTAGVAATGAVTSNGIAQQTEAGNAPTDDADNESADGPPETPPGEADNESADDADEDDGQLIVESLYAPESVAPGDNVTVVAEIANDGDERTTEQVEFRIGGDVVDRQFVTVEDDEDTTVSFTASTEGAEPGDVRHGVFTESDGEIATLTVSESFALDSVDAPESVDAGENVTIDATVSNPNDFETTQSVTFRLDGETIAQENVTLDSNEAADVNTTLDTEGVDAGTYVHSVFTRDSGQFLELNVTEAGSADAAVTFDDQESDGTTVTVQNVTVPSNGYVVIHNETLLEGDAVGSVVGVSEYLEAGQYDNVTVELFDVPGATFDDAELTEDQTLIAMPHNETSGDETYDFVSSAGIADPPFVVNESAVTDAANITVAVEEPPAPENETETPDDETETPIEGTETESPTDETETPIEGTETESPTDETETPIEGTETESPTDGTETSTEGTDTETLNDGTEETETSTAVDPGATGTETTTVDNETATAESGTLAQP